MTMRKASFQAANTEPAEDLRLSLSANLITLPGVVGKDDFLVTASGTPDMNVHVAAGGAWVYGSQTATQGPYGCYMDASATVAIATSNPSNPRIDRIVLLVDDQGGGYGAPTGAGSTTANTPQIIAITGTAAASPSAPAKPQNAITLALVAVPAAASSILSGDITDERPFTNSVGGMPLVTSTTRPSNVRTGQQIYEIDTQRIMWWDGTAWRTYAELGAWNSSTTAFTYNGSTSGLTQTLKWRRVMGTIVEFVGDYTIASGTGVGTLEMALPVNAAEAAAAYPVIGSATYDDASSGWRAYDAIVFSTTKLRFADTRNGYFGFVGNASPIVAAIGDSFHVEGRYKVAVG